MGVVEIRVQPRASREEIAGERGAVIVVRVTAPPADGAANEAVRRLVAKKAGVAKSRVTIVRGGRARGKVVRVEGIGDGDLRGRLLQSR